MPVTALDQQCGNRFDSRHYCVAGLVGATPLAATATPALAANPVAATVDVLVVRPISFLGTVAGAGLWTITSPFTFINGTAAENYDLLVKTPGEYTFTRPLGEGV